jgi:hypothetical protein
MQSALAVPPSHLGAFCLTDLSPGLVKISSIFGFKMLETACSLDSLIIIMPVLLHPLLLGLGHHANGPGAVTGPERPPGLGPLSLNVRSGHCVEVMMMYSDPRHDSQSGA